ncbi:hypothetical protein T265_09459 [Opisthorchis viverrini]|uniref:Uncharacterized protein n=1 Tax=Opisthorchis viverrini TaxID=6198 RepID=A0A074ZA30_OPIVI|nr:hypothetical protein T265_09459 [Opisthorchis viverrini]KER22442.1 hypothetical protein T265_09459 [Opisthorchis viverrini]
MALKYTSKRAPTCLAMISAIVLYGLSETIFFRLLHEQLRLLPNSQLYRTLFVSPPLPEYHRFYLFNITNPDQMVRGERPRLKQVGPFVFRVDTEIMHTQFSKEPRPRTLEYGFRSQFYFENQGSASSYEENIFIPNLIHQANECAAPGRLMFQLLQYSRYRPRKARLVGIVSNRLKVNYPDAVVSLTPKEALWGYDVVAFGKRFKLGLLSSTWPNRAADLRRLQVFDNRCLRTIARLWISSTLHVVVRKEPFEEVGRLTYAARGQANSTKFLVYDILQLNVKNLSAVTPFRCLAAMLPEGSTRAGILPGFPSLERGSREAEFGFEPQTIRLFNSSDITTYVVDTGAEDVRRTGTVLSIDSHRLTTYYEHEEPNLVSGKVGFQTAPNAKVGDVLEITSKSMCRKISFVANLTRPSKNHDGVKLLNFRLHPMDSTTNWSERQYCLRDDACVPQGLISLDCHREEMRGIRLYVSLPLFLRGDPRLKERFEFLDPVDLRGHDTEINVEPLFAGLLETKRRLSEANLMECTLAKFCEHKQRFECLLEQDSFANFTGSSSKGQMGHSISQYSGTHDISFRRRLAIGSAAIKPSRSVDTGIPLDDEKVADYDTLEALRTSVLKPFELLQNCLKALTGLFTITTVVLAIAVVFILVARNRRIVSPEMTNAAKFSQDNLSETSSSDLRVDRKYSNATVSETI